MSGRRLYSRGWLKNLQGMDAILDATAATPSGSVSSAAVWTAAFQCVFKGQNIIDRGDQEGIPFEAVAVCLRILGSANTLAEGINLLGTIGNLGNFQVRLELQADGPETRMICVYRRDDVGRLSNIEILHVNFLMAAMNCLIGTHIPFTHFYCRSPDFISGHESHPDFQAMLVLADESGCRFPSSWLEMPVGPFASNISIMDVLIWLVYDRPQDLILPQREAMEAAGSLLGHSADNMPVFKEVGGRQKRRRLVAQSGLTLRDLKLRYITRKAKFMLVEGRLTVSQIATELGYSDEGSFRRLFKKMTGASPIEFIKSADFRSLSEISDLMKVVGNLHPEIKTEANASF